MEAEGEWGVLELEVPVEGRRTTPEEREQLFAQAEEEAAQVSALLKEEMEGAFPLSVRLVADVSQGENWYEAKK